MHTPLRTCIGCRKVAPQRDLIRIALQNGEPPQAIVDTAKTYPGRGAWMHRDPKCLSQATQKNVLSRAFRTRVQPTELVITA